MSGLTKALTSSTLLNRKLPPWEENAWFDTVVPKHFNITAAGGRVKLASADPRRVAILFTVAQTGQVFVAPDPQIATDGSQGQAVQSSTLALQFHQSEWGVMVTQEWWGVTTVISVFVDVWELILREWPRKDED